MNATFCSACSPPKRTDTPPTSSSVAASTAAGGRAGRTYDAASSASGAAASAAPFRPQRAASRGRMPSGAMSTTAMIAAPYTTPWIPGRRLPSSAWRISPSGTRITAPSTGPATVAMPPNRVTISGCAEASIPNTVGGVTMSSTTA